MAWIVARSAPTCAADYASHGDDDFPSGMSRFEIPDSLSRLAQRVRSVDDRRANGDLQQLLARQKLSDLAADKFIEHLHGPKRAAARLVGFDGAYLYFGKARP